MSKVLVVYDDASMDSYECVINLIKEYSGELDCYMGIECERNCR